ncbi:helix-turn-helix domain-containing protein [Streptomyces phaeofaciens]
MNGRLGFGELLRGHRRAARLTLEQLAEAAGVSARTLSDMERGRSRGPQHRTVTALADAPQRPGLGRVRKGAPSARRAGLAASGAVNRKAEDRPRTGCTRAIRQRGEVPCQASRARRDIADTT